MKTIKHLIALLLCFSLCAPLTQAQSMPQDAQAAKSITQDVLIIIQPEQVRFTAQKAVAELRLQIFDQTGQTVYDSGATADAELVWALRQANGEAVKSGLYAYTLTIKEAGADEARVRRGHFIVDRAQEREGRTDRLWITSQNDNGVGTELTVARSEGETVAGAAVAGVSRNGKVGDSQTSPTEADAASRTEDAVKQTTQAALTASTNYGRLTVQGSEDPLLEINHTGTSGFPAIWFKQDGAAKAYMWWDRINNSLRFGTYDANPVMTMLRGNVGIGTTTPTSRLEIAAQDGLAITGFQPFLTLRDTNAGGARSILAGGNGDFGFYPNSFIGGFPALLIKNQSGNVGIGVANPQAKLDVAGTTRTYALQITGGADFAENFEINTESNNDAVNAQVEAGMVVSIDPRDEGKLALSTQPYDRRVAGVVSGAGGVKPGMVMSQTGTLADGKQPVALSGRVYVWVDASQGAIEPGDLLTTSATLGHAMKATDAARAQGAIIGKAMTGLKEGKGLVLVLVTLQ
ncbi:MAG TPA: hypothetical protein PLD20_25410 [Blastocatellia bacterium]|nr:hypothetical protein [Blastocatellia bacterium]HMZ21297.1 hypothetical protein [Blastocatellia bacterium]HNG29926.1 hypothetical protein [Blastocatellia bacterium]